MKYWFVRSPFKTRKWEDVLLSGVFHLYGLRSYTAKKNIAMMKKGDMALWYSSSAGKMIYGTMRVKNKAFVDSTNNEWLSIDFIPIVSFINPIGLETIKQNEVFSDSNILKQKRISVIEISAEEYDEVVEIRGHITKPLPAIVTKAEKNG